MAKPATVKAVLAYAAQLRREAEREIALDPFASPYAPTDASARKACSRLGPEAAIDSMRKRAAMHKYDARQHAVIADRSENVHKGRQRKHRETREKQRAHLTPGRRIDNAIARMSMVASSSGAQIGQSVHGGTPSHIPPFTTDLADKARRIAIACVRQIEDLEDESKVRDMANVA